MKHYYKIVGFLILVAGISTGSFAQQRFGDIHEIRKSSSGGGQKIYSIPFSSKNNRIEFTVVNSYKSKLKELRISVIEAPEWIILKNSEKANLTDIDSKEVREISFNFDIKESAPVNEVARIIIEANSNSDLVWQKEILIEQSSPEEFELKQNYPNPFNPETTIQYVLSTKAKVTVEVYNMVGQKVSVLVNENQNAGLQSVKWDASGMASGMYLYRVIAEGIDGVRNFSDKKMLLIK